MRRLRTLFLVFFNHFLLCLPPSWEQVGGRVKGKSDSEWVNGLVIVLMETWFFSIIPSTLQLWKAETKGTCYFYIASYFVFQVFQSAGQGILPHHILFVTPYFLTFIAFFLFLLLLFLRLIIITMWMGRVFNLFFSSSS